MSPKIKCTCQWGGRGTREALHAPDCPRNPDRATNAAPQPSRDLPLIPLDRLRDLESVVRATDPNALVMIPAKDVLAMIEAIRARP